MFFALIFLAMVGLSRSDCNVCRMETVLGFIALCEPRHFSLDKYLFEPRKRIEIDKTACEECEHCREHSDLFKSVRDQLSLENKKDTVDKIRRMSPKFNAIYTKDRLEAKEKLSILSHLINEYNEYAREDWMDYYLFYIKLEDNGLLKKLIEYGLTSKEILFEAANYGISVANLTDAEQKIYHGYHEMLIYQEEMKPFFDKIGTELFSRENLKLLAIPQMLENVVSNANYVFKKFNTIELGDFNSFKGYYSLETFMNKALHNPDIGIGIELIYNRISSIKNNQDIFCQQRELFDFFMKVASLSSWMYQIAYSLEKQTKFAKKRSLTSPALPGWESDSIRAKETFDEKCGCLQGKTLETSGEISKFLDTLDPATNTFLYNARSLAVMDLNRLTKTKLKTMMNMRNFNPDPKALGLFENYWLEDIELLSRLMHYGTLEGLEKYDSVKKCIDYSENHNVKIQTEPVCTLEGSCQGYMVKHQVSPKNCSGLCQSHKSCSWFTKSNSSCVLFSECSSIDYGNKKYESSQVECKNR